MLKRSLYILVFLLIIAVATGCGNPPADETSGTLGHFTFPEPEQIRRVDIVPAAENLERIQLLNKGDEWQVNANGVFTPVNEGRVDSFFTQLRAIKRQKVITAEPDKHESYGVGRDAVGASVILKGDEGQYKLLIGRQAQIKDKGLITYVREDGNDTVYSVNGSLAHIYNTGFVNWVDSSQWVDYYNYWDRIEFTLPAFSSYVIHRTGNGWYLEREPLDSSRILNYIVSLKNFEPAYAPDREAGYKEQPADFKVVLYNQTDTLSIRGIVEMGEDQELKHFITIGDDMNKAVAKKSSFDHLFVGQGYFLKE